MQLAIRPELRGGRVRIPGMHLKDFYIGIDVGLANTAIAVIKGPTDKDVVALYFCPTDPQDDSRQMLDDSRRCCEIIDFVVEFLREYIAKDCKVLVEWFAPRFPVKRGWTTSIIVGLCMGVARTLGLDVQVRQPPLHVQVSKPPKDYPLTARARPHVLDALTHARLEWHRDAGKEMPNPRTPAEAAALGKKPRRKKR